VAGGAAGGAGGGAFVPVLAVWAGGKNTCARVQTDAGTQARCLGDNRHGQLGTLLPAASPTSLTLPTGDATLIAPGPTICWVPVQPATLLCAGRNDFGQHGNGTVGDSPTPANTGIISPSSVSVGPEHVCAGAGPSLNQRAQCWGSNAHQKLGRVGFTGTSAGTPGSVNNGARTFEPARRFSLGANHSCFTLGTSTLFCFGERRNGQLGTPGFSDTAAVIDVAATCNFQPIPCPPSQVNELAAGANHTCGLFGQQVWCTGLNDRGQAGADLSADGGVLRALARVGGLPGVPVGLAASAESTCALNAAGEVWCWGDNRTGQLGASNPPFSSTPVRVMGLPSGGDVITAGEGHFCLHTSSGEAWCWGRNDVGQCATGVTSPSEPPTRARF
jgi:alpha-tubulin suppressor-like RCC1 family protein